MKYKIVPSKNNGYNVKYKFKWWHKYRFVNRSYVSSNIPTEWDSVLGAFAYIVSQKKEL